METIEKDLIFNDTRCKKCNTILIRYKNIFKCMECKQQWVIKKIELK